MNIITVNDLVKKFKHLTAVDCITFEVKEGELFGLLGPNGAGKTTTIRMLTTLLPATSGYASVAGLDITKDKNEVRKHIGIVFQEPALDKQLTGRENLDFHARMYRMKRMERQHKIKEVLEMVELTDRAGELVEKYSGGMQRRLEIARGLMHTPKVLFLDEPTRGLDAQTRRKIWDYIRKLSQTKNMTVLLTTHYMEEADALCKRVGIMDQGKIVAMDTPKNLKNIIGADVIILELTSGNWKSFEKLNFVQDIVQHGDKVNICVENGETKIPRLMAFAQSNRISVKSVELHKPSLEDVFLRYTGTTIRERDANPQEKFRRM